MVLPERLAQIVDSSFLLVEAEETASRREDGRNYNNHGGIENEVEEENRCALFRFWRLGLACLERSPNERMNIGDVTMKLQHIRNAYVRNGKIVEIGDKERAKI